MLRDNNYLILYYIVGGTMIQDKINYKEKEYYKLKTIKGEKKEYVEYINYEMRSIVFFEIKNDEIIDIQDEEDLKKAIEKNCDTNTDIIY